MLGWQTWLDNLFPEVSFNPRVHGVCLVTTDFVMIYNIYSISRPPAYTLKIRGQVSYCGGIPSQTHGKNAGQVQCIRP